jgi:hypothetical protein
MIWQISEEHALSIFRVLFYSEDGGSTFLSNVGNYLIDYMTSNPEDCKLQNSVLQV